MPASKTIVDFIGRTVVQHYDDANRLLGTSFRGPSVTGHDRWDHYDDLNRNLGTSDDCDGFFGSYREHRDSLGSTPDETRTEGGLMGQWRQWLAHHRSYNSYTSAVDKPAPMRRREPKR
jgi:hypothetical protein